MLVANYYYLHVCMSKPQHCKSLLTDYQLEGTIIGNGTQGKIVRGQHIITKEMVAVKVYSLLLENKSFENEARLLYQCMNIDQVVKPRACFTRDQKGYLILPLFALDLCTKIMNERALGERQSAFLFKQICEGMQKCHEMKIAHLDLKPENILIDTKDDRVYICDFGSSYEFNSYEEEITIGLRGTLYYSAPEVKHKNSFNPVKADIWSLGILLHVMILGHFPSSKVASEQIDFLNGRINFSYVQNGCSVELYDLMISILQLEYHKRPTVNQILAHPWFSLYERQTSPSPGSPFVSRFIDKSKKLFTSTNSVG